VKVLSLAFLLLGPLFALAQGTAGGDPAAKTEAIENSPENILKQDEQLRMQQEAKLKNDLDLLQDLKNQREELWKKQQELDQQEEVLRGLLKDLQRRSESLDELRNTIFSLLKDKDQREAQNLSKLVKMYGAMPSLNAASLLAKLDTYTAISILSGLKIRKASEVFTLLPKEKAFVLSENFRNLWRENLIESEKIDKMISVFEGVESRRAAELISGYDNARMVEILTKMSDKALANILPRLSDEKKNFLLEEFGNLVRRTSTFSNKDEPAVKTAVKIFSQMDPRDAAAQLANFDDMQVILTFSVIDKERYKGVFDHLPFERKLGLIESYQREFLEQRIERTVYNKMIEYFSFIQPRAAAALVNKLNLETAASILMKLKQRVSGKILALVDRPIAQSLSKKVLKSYGQ